MPFWCGCSAGKKQPRTSRLVMTGRAEPAERDLQGNVLMNADLHQAVEAALASKRIGQPVFVRYLLYGNDPHRLERAIPILGRWLGQALECRHRTGESTGQISLSLLAAD